MKVLSPVKVALFSGVLLVLGFIIGLGYQSFENASQNQRRPAPQKIVLHPPTVRGLRISADDQLLAFSGIYNQFTSASRFVFDLKNSTWSAIETPAGWQDSMVQWGKDNRTVLYERSKIPRIVIGAKAGLYSEKVLPGNVKPQWKNQMSLSQNLQEPGEKIYAGFWTPQDQLVVKTQHDDRSLYLAQNGAMVKIDHSPGTYYQNRAVGNAAHQAYYVVRDVDRSGNNVALFRIHQGKSVQLGPNFSNVIWAYLSENAKWLLLCSNAADGQNWEWDLWEVKNNRLKKITTAQIPGDVIAVYWSPDFKHILGAVGDKLWLIDVPTLKVHQIGKRNDWHADDAAWLNHQNAVVIAAAGKLWKVDITSGERTELWEFPKKYWE
jgi:hypothetical protein